MGNGKWTPGNLMRAWWKADEVWACLCHDMSWWEGGTTPWSNELRWAKPFTSGPLECWTPLSIHRQASLPGIPLAHPAPVSGDLASWQGNWREAFLAPMVLTVERSAVEWPSTSNISGNRKQSLIRLVQQHCINMDLLPQFWVQPPSVVQISGVLPSSWKRNLLHLATFNGPSPVNPLTETGCSQGT